MTDRDAVAAALPGYDIGDELGRGGWGVVLAGRHTRLGRDVAIKQLPPAFASDPDVRARFAAEARLLASLDHPHIVPVYDYVERDGLCLLVMEQLSGGTAWTRFTSEGLDARSTCGMVLCTAVALEYAHSHGVLHRDIKPENLLFTGDLAQVKVADFGIARVIAGGRTMATAAGEVLGTPAYMAPEQATGGPVTPATDVYALGVTLYELLSGTLPFPRGESALAVLYQRVHTSPTPLPSVAPTVPDRIAELVMWALMTDPEHRPPTAHAFAMELAERATDVFGRGWLARTGLRASLGGQVAALTEHVAAVTPPPSVGGPVRPERVTRAVGPPPADPATLLPVAENAEDSRQEHLRELRLLLGRATTTEARRLASEIERAESTAHELRELALLRKLRSGELTLPPDDQAEVERLIGGAGTTAADRLGLEADASADELRAAAEAVIERWKRRAEHPLTSRAVAAAAGDVVRTCEGLLSDLSRSTR
ncbi:serine/threonine-protein kinase [Desertimonas flava]|uniref:serine/threonine-protein kinase n=1 Tax=Desertimonas flava TaxID=2064846 RepID=UPI000E34E2C6|nr:serine/threonine-protein kinase [Desertimonas flava]